MAVKALSPLPIGSVIPKGIIGDFIKTQMEGLTGHMSEAGYPFDSPKWGEEFLSTTGSPQWWVYEQCGYWIDGFVKAAVLSEDKASIEKAKSIIYAVIDNPDSDGYLGPAFMKKTSSKDNNRWAHVVFFRACMAMYEYTGDKKIVDAIKKHYLDVEADFSLWRDVLNVEIMLWVYAETGDKAMLELAEHWYAKYNERTTDDLCDKVALSDKKPYTHGVSYNEYSKLGAILYQYTGKEEYLNASVNAYKKVDKFFMLPSGCLCSNEFVVSNDYMMSYETCDISDFTWSLGYMFGATAETEYLDKIEKCIFNAGIGSVLENFRGLQYFSCANQVIADRYSNHNALHRGDKWMSYRPNPGTECCPGNSNRFMPNYVYRQYYSDKEGNVYSALFGEGNLSYNGIEIEQKTDFPFSSKIEYSIQTNHKFTFYIRIPKWAKGTNLKVDGKDCPVLSENSFAEIIIDSATHISIEFKQETEKHFCDNGVWFSRGPLVYSLGVKTKRVTDMDEERASEDFPAYNMYADSEWRYGFDSKSDITFVDGSYAGWSLCDALPKLELYGYKVKNWDFERYTTVEAVTWEGNPDALPEILHGSFVFTSRIPENPEKEENKQKLTLYPYGVCKLRITVFPKID